MRESEPWPFFLQRYTASNHLILKQIGDEQRSKFVSAWIGSGILQVGQERDFQKCWLIFDARSLNYKFQRKAPIRPQALHQNQIKYKARGRVQSKIRIGKSCEEGPIFVPT